MGLNRRRVLCHGLLLRRLPTQASLPCLSSASDSEQRSEYGYRLGSTTAKKADLVGLRARYLGPGLN